MSLETEINIIHKDLAEQSSVEVRLCRKRTWGLFMDDNVTVTLQNQLEILSLLGVQKGDCTAILVATSHLNNLFWQQNLLSLPRSCPSTSWGLTMLQQQRLLSLSSLPRALVMVIHLTMPWSFSGR